MTKEIIKKNSIRRSIEIISTRFELTPAQAWENGTNIRTAFKQEPKLTHVTLMAILKDAIDYLDMNKSFRHEGDYIDAVTYLITEFPVMKLEEWKIITQNLKAGKYGKMYERLKLPELVEIFQQFEGERAERMERDIKQKKSNELKDLDIKPLSEEQRKMWDTFKNKLDLPKTDTDERGRWDFIPHPNTPEK